MPPIPLSRSITNQQSSSQNANINNPDLDSAQASSTLHLPPSQPSPAPPPPTLAKPKSSPNLLDPNKLSSGRRPVDSFRAFSSMVPVGGQADLLGRLMGWGPVSAKERVEGSAKMETLPVRLSQDGETLPRESMSDFPGDCKRTDWSSEADWVWMLIVVVCSSRHARVPVRVADCLAGEPLNPNVQLAKPEHHKFTREFCFARARLHVRHEFQLVARFA